MLLNWFFILVCPGWTDLILNPETGKVSSKSLFQALGFFLGAVLATLSVCADIRAGRPVDATAVLLLLANGLGLAGLKVAQQYLNRRTQDENGPLAVPPPQHEVPPLMPQGPQHDGP